MRAALWLMGLFAVAVAMALFAGNNQSSVTWFWSPYRVDMSLNLALVLLFLAFVLLYAALRALAVLLQMPHQARRWRMQQKERGMNQSLLEALSHLQAGRFLRARKSALAALSTEQSLREAKAGLPYGERLSATAHLIAADASHALQDAALRDKHWQQALDVLPIPGNTQDMEIREGAQMRAARWALDDRDAAESIRRLGELPLGAGRRTIALRIKLKAARLRSTPPVCWPSTAPSLPRPRPAWCAACCWPAFATHVTLHRCSSSGCRWTKTSVPCPKWPSLPRNA